MNHQLHHPVSSGLSSFALAFSIPVALLLLVATPAHALDAVPDGSKGELTLNFTWKARVATRASDGYTTDTLTHRTTTVTCPVISDSGTISAIDGATPAQNAAAAKVGAAATAEVQAVPPGAIADMQALQKKLDACRKAGGSKQACASQAMGAMQANPEMMEQMGRVGQANPRAMAAAESAVARSAGRFQPWYNEGCRGKMIVNDSRTTNDPTLHGSERTVTVTTTGTQAIVTRETLVTVETDLNKAQTRYMIVSPDTSGFQQSASFSSPAKRVPASAMPTGVVIAGPFPGPIKNGSHEFKVAGGSVKIDWVFQRLR